MFRCFLTIDVRAGVLTRDSLDHVEIVADDLDKAGVAVEGLEEDVAYGRGWPGR